VSDASGESDGDSALRTADLADSAEPVFYDAGRGPLRVGRYLIYDQLSRGAFGIVYAAFDPDLDRKVAIKLVREVTSEGSSTESGGSVLMEAQATAQISHPNVVAIHDVGKVDAETSRLLTGEEGAELVFLVMEFLAGPTLRSWMRKNKDDRERILDVFCEAAAGLEAAHARQLVHLDFKPSNAMFSETGRLRVLDFGLARIVRRRARVRRTDENDADSSSGPMAGTPPYMAPEQHEGHEADGRADQYAFCVALYEALLGERPFDARQSEELLEQKKKGIDSLALSHLPRFLREVLWRGLNPDPS
jgi:serine/threonine protein kinase